MQFVLNVGGTWLIKAGEKIEEAWDIGEGRMMLQRGR
jgi:hypothetical protein